MLFLFINFYLLQLFCSCGFALLTTTIIVHVMQKLLWITLKVAIKFFIEAVKFATFGLNVALRGKKSKSKLNLILLLKFIRLTK